MRLNSLYDPDYSGSGHQPLYFDEWKVMFNKYIVYGCSYKVMIENLADTDGWLVVYVDNNPTFYPMTNIDTYQERPYTICKFIRRVQTGQNPNVNYVKGFVSIKKWSGIKKMN